MKWKVISGGQTGVDRGALLAAMDMGIDRGGWAPKGWRAEDGVIPEMFRGGMTESGSSNYLVRTRQNVVDSHGTLIITEAYPLAGGTLKTRRFCEEVMRSHFVVSLNETNAVEKTRTWLRQFCAEGYPTPFVLNVAGPRESKVPGIQERTRGFIKEVFAQAIVANCKN